MEDSNLMERPDEAYIARIEAASAAVRSHPYID